MPRIYQTDTFSSCSRETHGLERDMRINKILQNGNWDSAVMGKNQVSIQGGIDLSSVARKGPPCHWYLQHKKGLTD